MVPFGSFRFGFEQGEVSVPALLGTDGVRGLPELRNALEAVGAFAELGGAGTAGAPAAPLRFRDS